MGNYSLVLLHKYQNDNRCKIVIAASFCSNFHINVIVTITQIYEIVFLVLFTFSRMNELFLKTISGTEFNLCPFNN